MRLRRAGLCTALYALTLLLASCLHKPEEQTSDPNPAARANLQLGIAYLQRGELQKAHESLHKALKFNSKEADAHAVLGELYRRTREGEKADRHYQAALKLRSTDSNIMNNYAQFLCQQGRTEEAKRYFLQAAENPLYGFPEVPYTNLARCLSGQGKLDQAELFLRKALQQDATMPGALLQMARLQYNAGDLREAQAYIERYSSVTLHTASSLYLAFLIAKEQGDTQSASRHSLLLRQNFPDSDETSELNRAANSR